MGFFSKLFGKKEPVEQEPPYPSWVLDQSKCKISQILSNKWQGKETSLKNLYMA